MTGASGFIGAHTLDALVSAGHEVHALARHPGPPRDGVQWHTVDALEEPRRLGMLISKLETSHLLHLAWYAVPGRFWNAPENERWIEASLRLLRAFGEAGGTRAVMAGTCAEYAWGEEPLDELITPLRPATLYGACKHAAHVAATASSAQLGVSLAWGRIFYLYGPREHPDRFVASLARRLLAGEQVPTTDGIQRRDFMHVNDVARAFVTLIESELEGPVNICSGDAAALRDIVALIARATDGSERVRLGALARRPDDPLVLVGSSRRLRDELGFSPAIDLEAGIASTVEWWRERARNSTDAAM